MTREFTVFDVFSDMAHFRRPYAITTALTFPMPPRTALCGLVGAVLGLPKNNSLSEFRDSDAVFALQLLEPLHTGHVSINLLDTKQSPSFRPKAVNPHTIMRYEVIHQPRYRVWFSHQHLGPQLADALAKATTHYTPCLGLAWMVAWFNEEAKIIRAEKIGSGSGYSDFVSPIRTADLQDIRWNSESVYQRIRMPAEMLPDRKVERYEEYLVETTTQVIAARLGQYWRGEDGTCFSAL